MTTMTAATARRSGAAALALAVVLAAALLGGARAQGDECEELSCSVCLAGASDLPPGKGCGWCHRTGRCESAGGSCELEHPEAWVWPANATSATCARCSAEDECGACGDAGPHCGWCPYDQECRNRFADGDEGDCRGGFDDSCSLFAGRLLAGSFVVFVGGVLAAGGGLGGGGIFIPALVLISGFSPHVAIPLSKITIFGVAIGGYLVNHRKRHPSADRPLISYDTAMILEPATLLGSVVGVFLNVVFPAWLIIIFLVGLLSYAAKRTVNKGLRLRAKEREATASERAAIMSHEDMHDSAAPESVELEAAGGDSLEAPAPGRESSQTPAFDAAAFPAGGDDGGSGGAPTTVAEAAAVAGRSGVDYGDKDELDRIQRSERRMIPWERMAVLFAVLAVTSVLVLFKGGTSGTSVIGVECGTAGYWLLVVALVPLLGLVTHRIGLFLRRLHETKQRLGYRYAEGDVHWTARMVTRFPAVAVIAGVAAGFLGIGGGMVKGPLMLELGMIPSVAAATSSYMILFTSFSTSFQYVVLDRMPSFAWWYFVLGLVSAVLGHKGVGYVLRRYRKQSYISFLIAAAIVVSVVAMSALEIKQLVEDVQGGHSMGFHALCSGDDGGGGASE